MRYIMSIAAVLFACAATVAADAPANGSGVSKAPAAASVIASGNWGMLWACPPTFKVMRDTAIPSAKGKSVRISAAGNEFEPFQIVLRPKKQLSNVKVTPHTMLGPNGAKLDAWNIGVKNVAYVNVTEATSKDVFPGAYPDPLPDFQAFTAPASLNSPVWVTFYVPAGTKPGNYKGSVDVAADGMKKLSVPVELHVWNFALPSVSTLRTAYGCGMWQASLYQGATTLEQKRKLLDLYNKDFWRHRVAPYAPYAYYDIKETTTDGKVTLDFTEFDKAIEKYFPLFNSFMLPGSRMDVNRDGDNELRKIDYLRAVAEHLVDKGQLTKAYDYIFDEPTEKQYEEVNEMAKVVRMADPRIKVLLTEQVEPKLGESVDIWVPLIDSFNENAAKERQAKGEQVWWYVCCSPHHPYPNNFIDYPAIDQRILPWISWHYGVNGILYWETCYWQDNPWDVPMSQPEHRKWTWGNGDGHLLYPPVRKKSDKFVEKGPVDSIRWEMIREGIEDYDYFRILSDKAQLLRKDGKPSAALAKADEALKLVDECGKSRTEYTRDPAQLETARAKVAEAIEALD